MAQAQTSVALPVVDVQAIHTADESALKQLGEILIKHCETWGFFQIRGHGLDAALFDTVFAAAREFHALPYDAKMAIVVDEHHFHRGYIPLPSPPAETGAITALPDQSTAFAIMHEMAADDPAVLAGDLLQAPNQWPAELPELKTILLRYQHAMEDLARRLLRAFAAGFELPLDFFSAAFQQPTTFLRLVYYPPIPPAAPAELFSASAHTDSGFLTVLAQDDCGGLQVCDKQGQWWPVLPEPEALVINVADFFARWSGDRLHSARHRVRNESGRVRYSVPFFFDPGLDALLDPLPTAGRPAISYRQYLLDRTAAAQANAAATPQYR